MFRTILTATTLTVALISSAISSAFAADEPPFHEVFVRSDAIHVVPEQGQASVALTPADMQGVEALCKKPKDQLEVTVNGKKLPVTVHNYQVVLAGVATGYECPLPAPVKPHVEHVHRTWQMHKQHETAFSPEHHQAVLRAMVETPQGVFIKAEDLPKGWTGGDRQHILEAIDRAKGQLVGWKVVVDDVMYFVVTDACTEVCSGKSIIWHLHAPRESLAPPPSFNKKKRRKGKKAISRSERCMRIQLRGLSARRVLVGIYNPGRVRPRCGENFCTDCRPGSRKWGKADLYGWLKVDAAGYAYMTPGLVLRRSKMLWCRGPRSRANTLTHLDQADVAVLIRYNGTAPGDPIPIY